LEQNYVIINQNLEKLKMYYKTWQPNFPGFYETRFDFDLYPVEWLLFNDPDDVSTEHLDWLKENIYDHIDFVKYRNDVSIKFVETWFELADFDFVKNVKFDNLQSPREYNFNTDSINISVNLNFNKLVANFKDHPDFEKYIKEQYTSYDGFFSFYSNDPVEWLETVRQDSEHKIGAMLQCLGHDVDVDDIYERINEEVYQGNYINDSELIEAFNEHFETEITSLEELENFNVNPDQLILEF